MTETRCTSSRSFSSISTGNRSKRLSSFTTLDVIRTIPCGRLHPAI